MKIFDKDCKINFVDDNNVFVGFDNDQCCCENFGYIISKKLPTSTSQNELNDSELEGYNFNTKFFKENVLTDNMDCGGSVTFKLTKNRKSLYLTLYNCHNGYYGHGFKATIKGIDWQYGQL